jgi:hypothetical protein
VKYRWIFGDDGINYVETDTPTIEHIYRKKTYKVKLVVFDSKGNKAKTETDFTIPKLEAGDIIFCNTYGFGFISGFYTHSGIYW